MLAWPAGQLQLASLPRLARELLCAPSAANGRAVPVTGPLAVGTGWMSRDEPTPGSVSEHP